MARKRRVSRTSCLKQQSFCLIVRKFWVLIPDEATNILKSVVDNMSRLISCKQKARRPGIGLEIKQKKK